MGLREELLRRVDELRQDVEAVTEGKVGQEENTGQELDLEIGGQKARARGYRLVDLAWLPIIFGLGWIGFSQQAHTESTKTSEAAVAKVLVESNANIANALKESNTTTVQALRDLQAEQRRATDAIREIACLSDPAMRNRPDARDFCKRMSRDSR